MVGHLGLTPQSVHALGGYQVQGRGADAESKLIDEAKALEDAGVFCLVLELVPAPLAKKVTESVKIPTIGIGAGVDTSGQVLVLHDLLGFDSGFQPKFLKQYAKIGDAVSQALADYANDVKNRRFPEDQHSFLE